MNVLHNKKRIRADGGQVMMLVTLLLLIGSMVVVGGIMALVKSQVRAITELSFSKSTYILTEGVLEEVVYRHKHAKDVASTETVTEGTVTVVTTTTNIPGGKEILAVGTENGRVRKIKTELIEGDGVSFSFGVQTDTGGIILENSSLVDGNVYSNGPIVGANKNLIKGTAISAGPSGLISEIHATGSAFAHNIENSYIEEDAFFTSIDFATIVDGTKNPGHPDLATSTFPISETLLDSWATYAETADILTAECTAAGGHIIYNGDVTLGPAKIPCDVTFTGNGTTKTIAGVLWIEGDLNFTLGPTFEVHPAIGNKSVPIIVDKPSDRLTSGRIDMDNSGEWLSNGNRSYILLISRNESAEQGGTEKAITIKNSTGGKLLVYAGHGEISLRNSVSLTEITAWRVRLQQSTEVIYDTGLASAVFTAGPGGSYVIDYWKEVE